MKITQDRRSYIRSSIDTVQLLYYKTVKSHDLLANSVGHLAGVQSMPGAELIIIYRSDASGEATAGGDVVG